MDLPVQAVGLAWFEEETFDQVIALMKDRDRLAPTYAEWLKGAERAEKKFSGDGYLVVRALLRPGEFPDWCRANGHDVDSKGRIAFANWRAIQEYRKTHRGPH